MEFVDLGKHPSAEKKESKEDKGDKDDGIQAKKIKPDPIVDKQQKIKNLKESVLRENDIFLSLMQQAYRKKMEQYDIVVKAFLQVNSDADKVDTFPFEDEDDNKDLLNMLQEEHTKVLTLKQQSDAMRSKFKSYCDE